MFSLVAAMMGWGGFVHAQEVGPCDWRSGAEGLIEPWEDYTRTFSDGKVRIALVDRIEPGASPLHILILSPPYDVLGARQCRILSVEGTRGFADVDFSSLEADYDPSVGLIFELAVRIPGPIEAEDRMLRFSVNQASGAIEASLR
ncbi:hypothetical protein FIU86_16665 [Roseovarius sp. THAF9]|uniref:hypothetical protein n=1 Tax=Roseovarius sp. THAF9 TaxID=2587847 RepID=UPI00126796B4|nr:hypothetical protein [Roseovarius sp. THAF9]QFT94485.1 hypothetical protein FIU86_16665 [Roseovarius sp. THAF9]